MEPTVEALSGFLLCHSFMQFIHLFGHLFNYSYIHLLILSFIFIYPSIHLCIYAFISQRTSCAMNQTLQLASFPRRLARPCRVSAVDSRVAHLAAISGSRQKRVKTPRKRTRPFNMSLYEVIIGDDDGHDSIRIRVSQ